MNSQQTVERNREMAISQFETKEFSNRASPGKRNLCGGHLGLEKETKLSKKNSRNGNITDPVVSVLVALLFLVYFLFSMIFCPPQQKNNNQNKREHKHEGRINKQSTTFKKSKKRLV